MQFATVHPVLARTDLPVITDEEAAAYYWGTDFSDKFCTRDAGRGTCNVRQYFDY